MNKKIPIILVILTLLLPMAASVVTAADQNNPASYGVSIVVNTASTFTVTLPTGQTTLSFSGTQGTSNINAAGQTVAIPWAKINNTGAGPRNFSMGINAAPPAGITLKADDANDMASAITLGTTILAIPGGQLPISTIRNVWVKANYSASAPMGTHTNNIAIRNYLPVLQSITVSGPTPVDTADPPVTYTASGIDQEANTIPLGTITWSVAGTGATPGTGTITSGGVFTPTAAGDVIITAASGGKTGTKTVHIDETA